MEIDGRKIADRILSRLKKENKPGKKLAILLVGDDPASISFIKQKEKTAKELGIEVLICNLKKDVKEEVLKEEIKKLAGDVSVGGIIVQLPLPDGVGGQSILDAVPKEKDVDLLGENTIDENAMLSPAVEVVIEIFKYQNLEFADTEIVVIGQGKLVGEPIGRWLEDRCRELYLLDEGDSFDILRSADVVISGVGEAGVVREEMLKNGAGVIDFGYDSTSDGASRGDLAIESEMGKVGFYTPTPGGTGPILTAKLMENFYKLCSRKQ